MSGRVFVDVDAKIAESRTPEEKAAWESKRELLKKVDFCEGWDVWVYLHQCGHYEILQIPTYGRPISVVRAQAARDAMERKCCTRCSLQGLPA